MRRSRRRFVIASTGVGTALFAGCIDRSPGEETGNTGNGGIDDNGDGSDDACEPIDLERIDEPPHGPERPPQPEEIADENEWDNHHLGTGMDDEADRSFDQISLRYHEPEVDQIDFGGKSVFSAELITAQDEFDELVAPVGDESTERVDEIDFETDAVVVILSGFGSSSVRHEWVRVEENCEEIHVHGYYVWPYIQTDDSTSRVSGVVVEKPEADELERAWVSMTVAEDVRVNFHTDDDLQVLNNEDSDDGGGEIDEHGAVDSAEVVPVTRKFEGDWYNNERNNGIVVHFDDEEELRAVVDEHDDVEGFVTRTDFEVDAVFYLESAGPNACYRKIDVRDVQIIASDDGYFVRGNVTVVDDSAGGDACPEVITFPAVLIRVESEVDVRDGEFQITDGWGETETVQSMPMSELAQE